MFRDKAFVSGTAPACYKEAACCLGIHEQPSLCPAAICSAGCVVANVPFSAVDNPTLRTFWSCCVPKGTCPVSIVEVMTKVRLSGPDTSTLLQTLRELLQQEAALARRGDVKLLDLPLVNDLTS